MIGCRVVYRRACRRRCRRVFSDEFAGRVNKYRRLKIRDLLDSFSFSVIVVSTDGYAVFLDFCLLIIAIEYESSREIVSRDIGDDVAIFVERKTLIRVVTIRIRINGWIARSRVAANILCKRSTVAIAVVAPDLEPVGDGVRGLHLRLFHQANFSKILSPLDHSKKVSVQWSRLTKRDSCQNPDSIDIGIRRSFRVRQIEWPLRANYRGFGSPDCWYCTAPLHRPKHLACLQME